MTQDQYIISNQIVETMKCNNEKLIENNQRIEYLNFKFKEMSDNARRVARRSKILSIIAIIIAAVSLITEIAIVVIPTLTQL